MDRGIKYKILAILVALIVAVALARNYFLHHPVAVLDPAGPIAHQERGLIITLALLSLLVVLPVFALLIYIPWKYRESNTKAKYTPEADHSRLVETVWWVIPSLLIIVVSVLNWNSSHTLDPFRPIRSNVKPLTIQVIALDWKWLFIYPEQHIATVNYIKFPTNTPVQFDITADAPMNSFWIPRLGGQIYAMPGMSTQLHLLASKAGDYRGSSANISGSGFARMDFTAAASDKTSFETWVNSVKQSQQSLTQTSYNTLAKPTTSDKVQYYALGDPTLYDRTVLKYMPLGAVQ